MNIYAEGDQVRVGSEPGIVKRIRLDGSVDIWTNYGLRTVDSNLIRPARKGDHPPTPGQPAPARKGR